jgi:CRP-like cAMP-binding protein
VDRTLTAWPASSLLGRLQPAVRAALLELGFEREFPRNHTMVEHGGHNDRTLLLLHGAAKIVVSSEDGRVVLLGMVRDGDLAGEMTAIDPQESSANVVTCVRTTARVIDSRALKDFLRRQPEAHFAVTRMIIERLREANRRRVDYGLAALCKLARVMVELTGKFGADVDGRYEIVGCLTQAELGSLAGMATRTVEEQLGELQKRDIIELSYRKIVVNDLERLRKVAKLPAEIPR